MARSELDRSVELSMDAVDVLVESMRRVRLVPDAVEAATYSRQLEARATMIEAQRRYERGRKRARAATSRGHGR